MKSVVIAVLPSLLFWVCAGNLSAGTLQRDVDLPVSDHAGHSVRMHIRICEPDVATPSPAIVFVHGDPGERDRRKAEIPACNTELVAWFVNRGFAFAFPLRLGFGATGGPFLEGSGKCSQSDYVRSGDEIARQTDSVVRYLSTRAEIDAGRVVVLGHSTGGWGTLAYDRMYHPGVVGFINMAGGKGGHYGDVKNEICRMDQLVDAAGNFGAGAKTSMLWIYARDDSFFGPKLALALFTRFTQAGGVATLLQPDHFGTDGHLLLFEHGGSAYWGPRFAAFLTSLGFDVREREALAN